MKYIVKEKQMKSIEYISENQQRIIEDEARTKLVNGCAGSRKTDTLVKLGAYHMRKHKHNVLFLTLVSSITHELQQRMQELLGISIPRVGRSNHYLGEYEGAQVSIANFDAFVHKQLEYLKVDLSEYGDCHDWKTRKLCEYTHEGSHTELIMKNGDKADIVLVDEFQDMEALKAKILVNILKQNHKLHGIAVGDMMQTIFPKAVSADLSVGHPMNMWKHALKPKMYSIDICYRCPSPHINFVNMLLSEHYGKFYLPEMKSTPSKDVDNHHHKPVLFCHDKISNNHGAYAISQQICAVVRVLFGHDRTLYPGDVAVIMKKSNNNHVFEQLKMALSSCYDSMGFGSNRVVHFETRGDGYHNSIDWSKAEDKTVLLSIHGDKGKGHKVVFFIGMSHRCLPSENNVFKTTELIDISLVNVALTRSTKYLFVGFTVDAPSRYLSTKKEESLKELTYSSWTSNEWLLEDGVDNGNLKYKGNAPHSPYREILLVLNRTAMLEGLLNVDQPNFNRELRLQPLNCPAKDILRVKDDISKDLSCDELFMSWTPTIHQFGHRVTGLNRRNVSDDMIPMIGIMGELLVYRQLCMSGMNELFLKKMFGCIVSSEGVLYTDDDRILNMICDYGLNQYVNRDTDVWRCLVQHMLEHHAKYLDTNPDVKEFITHLKQRKTPAVVLSKVFSTKSFRQQLKVFLSKELNEKIPSRVFWNVTLCFNELNESIRRPMVLLLLNKFNEDITDLHDNVQSFCQHILSETTTQNRLQFQGCHKVIIRETDRSVLADTLGFVDHEDLDADRFSKGYTYGLIGKSDLNVDNVVYEFKTSSKVDISREWIIQALAYCCIPYSKPSATSLPMVADDINNNNNNTEGAIGSNPHAFVVVNLLTGTSYTYQLPETFDKCQFLQKIMNDYGYHDWMSRKVLEQLESPPQLPGVKNGNEI